MISDRIRKLLLDPDCLFHGSPVAGLTLIEPRPAKDVETGNSFNNDRAVFASHDPRFSIPFSLIDFAALPDDIGDFEWSVGGVCENDAVATVLLTLPEKLCRVLEPASGTLYILPKADFFETNGLQWKSRQPVRPLQSIAVTIQDFYDAGGIVDWQKSPAC